MIVCMSIVVCIVSNGIVVCIVMYESVWYVYERVYL